MKNKIVIYTAIFGGKDNLIEPKFIPEGCDFVCFTDQDLVSDIWKIRKEEPLFKDPVRSAKVYKILPHKFLLDYEISIYVDGNVYIRGDVNELINKYLGKYNLAIYDHNQQMKRWKKLFWIKDVKDCRNCIYDEAEFILSLNKKGKFKDNSDLIIKQMEKYRRQGYPKNNGLIAGMVILRKHNEFNIIKVMEDWWKEIKEGSRRDQLSFNYIAWKDNLDFVYMKGNVRSNKYFLHTKHKIKSNLKL
ncbi:DUF616 domain-containing protein [Patescibacteria group bacterium]|nr:DUF616 domain-containing protein [Patescibacteria group bacterium]